ncbi:MAG: hypothetical protein GWN79_26070, partial [Actinobacteria bacterium]|nr:hypothetical protein [Actinomycetota bacterium]NIS36356.1 hypothetical protein [Actinomycetota bacterium]NIT98681.1 hypothetical protein [Actinomycetota bacterium]NIU22302.1 hypothetical protein [Actinomycetota bacterium]NIU70885.1 hypothetical protein [Actinomycetota bacterium]
ASADQRAGRAGRTGPGVAIRLWSKVEHGTRPPHLPPAITAVELSGLVLDLARAGITDPATVPFLDPPPADHWDAATTVLRRLGALDTEGEVTELGSRMADLPLHPRLARTVADGRRTWLACLLAALLEDRDVLRGRPADLPADLAVRLALLLDPDRHHPAADGRALRRARERARDLARRAGLDTVQAGGDEPPDPGEIGATLVKGFPERVARARPGVRGRFVLADGRSAKLSRKDDLIDARGLLALDLGGRPKDPTINRAVRLEAAVDHLVYGTPDLDATVADLARQWGVTASPGGRHDGRGTRNALLGLGGGAYLEVIGPDPDQPPPPGPRPFGLDDIDDPALLTWAARVPDIDVWVAWARARGIDPGDPSTMQRTTPTGKVLQWRLTAPPPEGDGVLPFLIEWPGVTPAADAAPGITLTALELHHPDPAMAGRLAEHAIPVDVAVGPRRIAATLLAPTGVVELG